MERAIMITSTEVAGQLEKSPVTNETVVQMLRTVQRGAVHIGKSDLTVEQQDQLQQAMETEAVLFSHFQRLVPYILSHALHIRPYYSHYEDSLQAGYEGVIKAIRKSDISRLAEDRPLSSLTSYVREWARQTAALQLGNEGATIRVPIHVQTALRTETEHGESAKISSSMRTGAARSRRLVSCDRGRGFGTNREYTDTEGRPGLKADPLDTVAAVNENEEDGWPLSPHFGLLPLFNEAMSKLRDRDRLILELRLYDDETLEEVATRLGVTRERVRQLEARGLAEIRISLGDKAADYRPYNDYYDHARIITLQPQKDEAIEELDRALAERLNSLVSQFQQFNNVPNTVKRVVNDAFRQAQRMLHEGHGSDEVIDTLYGKTLRGLLSEDVTQRDFNTESKSYAERARMLDLSRQNLPGLQQQREELENSIKINQRLTYDFPQVGDRFEAHVASLREMRIILERVQREIDSISSELNADDLRQWLRDTMRFYDLPARLSQTALSVSLQALEQISTANIPAKD